MGLTAFAQFLMNAEMQQRSESALDPLTGLLNRTSLPARFAEIAEQAALADNPVCVVVCDLDGFKAINDEHGHDRGDAVLREAALLLRRQLRSFELVYRLGGEEFLLVLPGLTLGEGRDVAERTRAAFEAEQPGGPRGHRVDGRRRRARRGRRLQAPVPRRRRALYGPSAAGATASSWWATRARSGWPGRRRGGGRRRARGLLPRASVALRGVERPHQGRSSRRWRRSPGARRDGARGGCAAKPAICAG